MSNKNIFIYSTEQRHLHDCQSRINGVVASINEGLDFQLELERLEAAKLDILSRISEADLIAMQSYENRILTPAERAAEAKALAERMAENRDRPSI